MLPGKMIPLKNYKETHFSEENSIKPFNPNYLKS